MEGFLVEKGRICTRFGAQDFHLGSQGNPCTSLQTHAPENLNVSCHSKFITGNTFPGEEEEGEQEQMSQKVGVFLLYNQL